jgi:hypothetical protein
LIPVFIDLMMEHPQYVWNSAIYPVIALD